MPPKKSAPRSDSTASLTTNEQGAQPKFSEREFSTMLLNALRHDEEVKTCVAMLVRSRETDVYTAVVKCLRESHDDITSSIGMTCYFCLHTL